MISKVGLSYDPASQVTNILHQIVSSATQVNQAAYAYNPVGNRTSLTDRRGAQAFGYDQLDRLTSASHPLLGTPQAFAYDPVGNRTIGGSVVNAGNQLTADATFAYQYDDNGNLTRKTFLATGNYSQYTYDAENRLTKVEEFAAGNPTAFATSTYRYDGLGRRIEKVAKGKRGGMCMMGRTSSWSTTAATCSRPAIRTAPASMSRLPSPEAVPRSSIIKMDWAQSPT